MHWTQIVNDIRAAGMTQVEIARAVCATQSTISELSTGKHGGRLSFEVGAKLADLWRKKCAKGSKRAKLPTLESEAA